MSLIDSFKLEKLKIFAFCNKDDPKSQVGEFEAMFNPESITQQYKAVYAPAKGTGGVPNDQLAYIRAEPSELKLELLLDGTGVTDMMALPPGPAFASVRERVDAFLGMAFHYQGETHQPNYLQVQWGDLWEGVGFDCRLVAAEVAYSRFGRDGKPLRAVLHLTLRSDKSWVDQIKKSNPTSPDLTHRHTVVAGDTLAQLTQDVYGSAEHVLAVARRNGLNDLRYLQPGTELVFDPLPGHGGLARR